jgi:hypothetical protein
MASLLAGEGEGPWADDDAQWFQQNPDRSCRLRQVYEEEEKTDMAHAQYVVVLQPPHDHRIRLAIHTGLTPEVAETIASNDAYIVMCLAPIFSTALDHVEGSA